MARKSVHLAPLLAALPPWSAKRWLYPFEIAARDPALKTDSLHDVLRRAVEQQKVAERRMDPATGRWQYARARAPWAKKRGRR